MSTPTCFVILPYELPAPGADVSEAEQKSMLGKAENWVGTVTTLVEEGTGLIESPVEYAKSFFGGAFKKKIAEVKATMVEKTLYLYLVDEYTHAPVYDEGGVYPIKIETKSELVDKYVMPRWPGAVCDRAHAQPIAYATVACASLAGSRGGSGGLPPTARESARFCRRRTPMRPIACVASRTPMRPIACAALDSVRVSLRITPMRPIACAALDSVRFCRRSALALASLSRPPPLLSLSLFRSLADTCP